MAFGVGRRSRSVCSSSRSFAANKFRSEWSCGQHSGYGEELGIRRGSIVGEAVMMGLAPYIGRQKAHDVVYNACKESIESDIGLLDVLLKRDEVTNRVGAEELQRLCNPVNYLGASALMVEDVLRLKSQTHGTQTPR